MKKIILSTLLLLLGMNTAFAQEKLVDILKNLSVEDKVVNTTEIAEGTDYLELMESKQNFQIKEHDYIAYYINSYKNFIIYLLEWKEAYTEETYKEYYQLGLTEFGTKFALLFDNEKKRCYMLKYSYSGSGSESEVYNKLFRIRCINRYNEISVYPDFENGINSILRLDENFSPLYGTIVNTYIIDTKEVEYIDRKKDEFAALFEFKQCNDTIYNRLLNIPPININQVTEEELAKLFSDEHGYTEYIYPNWEEQNMGKLFKYGRKF